MRDKYVDSELCLWSMAFKTKSRIQIISFRYLSAKVVLKMVASRDIVESRIQSVLIGAAVAVVPRSNSEAENDFV
jgi:hypothetical protein